MAPAVGLSHLTIVPLVLLCVQSKQDLPPPQESDEKFAAPPALQSPFSASEKQPEASCSSGTETGSTSQADRAGSTEMVQLDMQSAPPTDARQSWADHAATSTLAPVQGPPNVKAASSPPKVPPCLPVSSPLQHHAIACA